MNSWIIMIFLSGSHYPLNTVEAPLQTFSTEMICNKRLQIELRKNMTSEGYQTLKCVRITD